MPRAGSEGEPSRSPLTQPPEVIDLGAPELAGQARRALSDLEEGAAQRPFAVVACERLGAGELEALAAPRLAGNRVLLLVRTWPGAALAEVFARGLTRNVLAGDRARDETALKGTLRRLCRGPIAGAADQLGVVQREVRLTVRGAADRASVIQAARGLATGSGAHPRLVDAFCSAADELVTNGIYHAAVGPSPASRPFSGLPRDAHVELPSGSPVEVTLSLGERMLAACVRDPFGGLSAGRVLSALSRAYGKGKGQIRRREGGAGIGLYVVAEGSAGLVLQLCPGRWTEAIALVPIAASYREAAEGGRGLNVFEADPPSP